jgi:hypothetical protein
MTYINPKKENQYIQKIKTYSENMLSYEYSECETALEAELQFGADQELVQKIKRKMELIKGVVDERTNK